MEFWVVATRPENVNGLAMDVGTARREIGVFEDRFRVLRENELLYPAWLRLVSEYGVSGRNAHDARLVAAMKVNGIGKILTFNARDFVRYREIEVIHPVEILAGA